MPIDRFEVRRKILHVAIGTFLFLLILLNLITPLQLFLVIVFGSILSLISKRYSIPVISWFLDNFDRKRDHRSFPGKGALSLFIGMLLAWKLFSQDIAYASMMVLILGDAVSHLVGSHLGKIRNPLNGLKYLEGTLIGGVAGSIGALIFVNPLLAILGSFGAMIIEAIQVRMNDTLIDDNIIIPLAAGAIMTLIRTAFAAIIPA